MATMAMSPPTMVMEESMASVRLSLRLKLILISTTESMVELVTMVESMAIPTQVSTMESMASVKLRLRLILTSTMECMVELVTMVESMATPSGVHYGVYGKREAEAKADPYFYNGVYGGIGHYGGVYGYPYSGVHYGVYGKREAEAKAD